MNKYVAYYFDNATGLAYSMSYKSKRKAKKAIKSINIKEKGVYKNKKVKG